jgi:hypothetical protein
VSCDLWWLYIFFAAMVWICLASLMYFLS